MVPPLATSQVGVIIGRLVPFILVRQEETGCGAGVGIDGIARGRVTLCGTLQLVGTVLRQLLRGPLVRLPVGDPVGETGGVEPVHIGYRSVGRTIGTRRHHASQGPSDGVGVIARLACPQDSRTTGHPFHRGVVKPVIVRNIRDSIEKGAVLPERHFIFSDPVFLGHGTVSRGGIGGIGGISDSDHGHVNGRSQPRLQFNQRGRDSMA